MKNDRVHPPSEELFAYRDGELGPEKRAMVEAHVVGCSVCRALIDQVSALEAELRQSPDSAPEGYLDRLSESVRGRVAGTPSETGARAGAVREIVREKEKPREERGEEAARVEREERRESGRVKEAPRLPWAAVIGTASAAAAVLVVVVILIRQGPYQRMVMPERASTGSARQESGAVKEEAKGQAQNEPTPPAGGAPVEPVPSAPSPPAEGGAKQGAAQNRLDEGLRDQLSKKADEVAMKAPAAAQAPAAGAAGMTEFKDKAEEQRLESDQKIAARAKAEPQPLAQKSAVSEAGYASILSRFGLPALWNASVTPNALSDAEPGLRSFYMSGNAGADSARVRLYLAEAARLRYGPGDGDLYDEIKHHYQRVIELAGPDAEVARVARERLRSLER
jgi:hypothetical protein